MGPFDSQQGMLLSIMLLGFGLAVVTHVSGGRKASVPRILLYGGVCAIFGLMMSCLTGRECVDVLMLKETAGFGRAYAAGLGIVIAAPFVALLRLFRKR
jgi:hypothetical protein